MDLDVHTYERLNTIWMEVKRSVQRNPYLRATFKRRWPLILARQTKTHYVDVPKMVAGMLSEFYSLPFGLRARLLYDTPIRLLFSFPGRRAKRGTRLRSWWNHRLSMRRTRGLG